MSEHLNVGDVTGPRWAGGTRNPDDARRAPWDRPDGCFGHCDPEGWFAPCRTSEEKMTANIRGVLAWRQKYARDALTPETFDRWLKAHDREVAARELEAFADAHRMPFKMFERPDGSAVTVGDLLRERAAALRSGTEGSTDDES